MCGIAGIVHNFVNVEEAKNKIFRMINIIEHRGPDDLRAVIGKKFLYCNRKISYRKS